jgi:hypothetical protein
MARIASAPEREAGFWFLFSTGFGGWWRRSALDADGRALRDSDSEFVSRTSAVMRRLVVSGLHRSQRSSGNTGGVPQFSGGHGLTYSAQTCVQTKRESCPPTGAGVRSEGFGGSGASILRGTPQTATASIPPARPRGLHALISSAAVSSPGSECGCWPPWRVSLGRARPPTCWEALISPDARLASCGLAPVTGGLSPTRVSRVEYLVAWST